MLRVPDCIGDVVGLVSAADFSTPVHQWIFDAAIRLWQEGQPVDAHAVGTMLANRLKNDGGLAYLVDCWEKAGTGAFIERDSREIRDYSILRRLQLVGREVADLGEKPSGPADEMLAEAERKVYEISQLGEQGSTVPIREAILEELTRYDLALQTGAKGLPVGLVDVDRILGGLHKSELIIVAARPSVGKTSFGLQVAKHIAVDLGMGVFFASIEMNKRELASRMMCAQAGISSHQYRSMRLGPVDADRITEAKDILSPANMHIDDNSSQTLLRITSNARRLKKKHDIRLIVLDYLQLVDSTERYATRNEAVGAVSRGLKRLARELEIPVMAMAQLNRASEEHQKPRLSDLRESGSIEQDADTVMMLYRSDQSNRNIVSLTIEKQRNGPTGEVELWFNQDLMTFMNMHKDGEIN